MCTAGWDAPDLGTSAAVGVSSPGRRSRVKQRRRHRAQIVEILAQAASGKLTAIEVCRIDGVSAQGF
jgi:hypothetical protein